MPHRGLSVDAWVTSSLGGAVVHVTGEICENWGQVPAVLGTAVLRLLVTVWPRYHGRLVGRGRQASRVRSHPICQGLSAPARGSGCPMRGTRCSSAPGLPRR